ncbi:MAG: hypothetical protein IPN76_08580 [Saprospiraceae bacterium]|jgi:hypothetical protein|nr:hypothetical protein [Saprospiraceae bacterium]
MGATQESTKLSNLQMELLKLYARNVSDEELKDIRKMLAEYYGKKADEEMDRLWEENGWTQDTMEEWLKEDLRVRTK